MWLFHNAKYRFIEMRRKAYVVSALILTLGVGMMLFNGFSIGASNWQNYGFSICNWQACGVDFTGGSLVQVSFTEPTTDTELRDALGGSDAPPITRFGDDNEFVIRAPLQEGMEIDEVAADLSAMVAASYGEGQFEVVRQELVGPKIGAELETKAGLAVLFSLFLTLIYIAIRFEFRFGVASVIATFHDVLLTLGVLALARVEISLPTVAAILTILGYSLNDTIVVFDRIRENLNSRGGRRENPYSLVNRSINETLPRTVLTSGTTLAVLLSLLALGGANIRDFTLVLILGVIIGTYSSIFIAAPALLEIQRRYGTGEAKDGKKTKAKVAARA